MINTEDYKRFKVLLGKEEVKNLYYVGCVIILASISTVMMVGAIFPLLNTLSNPEYILENKILNNVFLEFNFDSEKQFMLYLSGLALFLIIFSNVMQIYRVWLISNKILMKIHSLSAALVQTYLTQSYEKLDTLNYEQLKSKILSETVEVVNNYIRPITDLVSALLTILSISALLLVLKPIVTIYVILVFFTFYGFILFASKIYITRQGQIRTESNLKRFNTVKEAFNLIKLIKLRDKEKHFLELYSSEAKVMTRAFSRIQFVSQVPHYVLHMLGFSILILAVVKLTLDASESMQQGLLDALPTIGLFAFAGQRMLPEVSKIYAARSLMLGTRYSASLLVSDIEKLKKSEVSERLVNQDKLEFSKISLVDLSYNYGSSTTPALDRVSININRGEKVGIVGQSGSGKSTLVDVIVGLRYPTSGNISVDGVNICPKNVYSWKSNIGYIPQDIVLMDDTIVNNILFHEPFDKDKFDECIKKVGLFESQRSDSRHTGSIKMNDNALQLSGGQRQMVAAARAMYTDPDLIIFDEATSSLDNISQENMIKFIERIPNQKTVIVVAHRLKNVMALDKVVVLKNGSVVGYDSPKELQLKNIEFQKLLQGELLD